MDTKSVVASLQKHWVHSHEEDTETLNVFRPASFRFPPSRGRKSFVLMPHGKLVEHSIAASDGTKEVLGTWKLDDNNETLAFYSDASAKPMSVMRIVSVDKQKLVVVKMQ
jgi:hypothetical protein